MSIADTIIHQLGWNKFIAMTGCRNFINIGNGVTMHIPKNKSKANRLKISINKYDTYDLTFTRVYRIFEVETVQHIEGIDADQLKVVFADITGLATHL